MEKEGQDIQGKGLEIIEGEFITISQSTVRSVEGGHIEMQQVGALSIDGERVEATQCASLMIRGEELTLTQSLSQLTIGSDISLDFSFSPITISRCGTSMNRSAACVVAAGSIKTEKSASLLLLANRVEGEVNTLFDLKSAAALGAVLGGIWGLFSLFKRR